MLLCLCVFGAETKSGVTLCARQIFSEFFTVQVLTELCRQLVLNYFPLREDELQCWMNDPENFSESLIYIYYIIYIYIYILKSIINIICKSIIVLPWQIYS